MAVTEGQLISDGTAVWKVKKIGSEVPAGIMQMFAGNTIPAGWLLCDGSAISRTDYAKLFSAIGTTWGAGDGSTTFNLPNSIGRFAEGAATSGSYHEAGLPNIEGQINARKVNSSNFIAWNVGGGLSGYGDVDGALGVRAGTGNFNGITTSPSYDKNTEPDNIYFNASNSNSIYGSSTTVQPNSFTVRYIIKY